MDAPSATLNQALEEVGNPELCKKEGRTVIYDEADGFSGKYRSFDEEMA